MTVLRAARMVVLVGLAWTVVWAAIGATLSVVIGIVDPSSIDAGEGPGNFAVLLGGIGAVTGLLFGALLLAFERRLPLHQVPRWRVAIWGALAGLALPLLTPVNDAVVVNSVPFGVLAALVCAGVARRWSGRVASSLSGRSGSHSARFGGTTG